MAKSQNTASAPELGAAESHDIVLANQYTEKASWLESMEQKPDSELIPLTGAEWLKVEPGQVLHFVAAGITDTPNPQTGDPQKTAVLYDKNGKQWYSSLGLLVSTLKQFTPEQLGEGVAIRVTVKDKVKGKNGLTYQDLDIYRMP